MRFLILAMLAFISFECQAQLKSFIISVKGDTLNRVDNNGKKQGPWVVHTDDLRGEPGYEEEGYFENNKKEGKWRRYTLAGDLTAIENYKWGEKDGKQEYYTKMGDLLREKDYEIAPFLRTIFLSEDFYSEPSVASHIKSPTELIVSTYRKLGLAVMPGIPDPYLVSKTLGQVLLYPPTVAGWGQGRSWITPGILFERPDQAHSTSGLRQRDPEAALLLVTSEPDRAALPARVASPALATSAREPARDDD
ncbi:MAG: DUF1800 family protein, partial [Sphingobacteriales bacterium]|nr:DUF1800 family protein [Sphingobacteriales bacterium]